VVKPPEKLKVDFPAPEGRQIEVLSVAPPGLEDVLARRSGGFTTG
jgi:hypothetical protein